MNGRTTRLAREVVDTWPRIGPRSPLAKSLIPPASVVVAELRSAIEALVLMLMLSQQMPFAAVARLVGESAYRCMEVCNRYVEMALGLADFSGVTALPIDETSRVRGHTFVTLAADAQARRVIFVTEGRDASTIEALAADLAVSWLPARTDHLREHRHVAGVYQGRGQ